jgi:hypothetical protein
MSSFLSEYTDAVGGASQSTSVLSVALKPISELILGSTKYAKDMETIIMDELAMVDYFL